ncbi:MAG TPA: ATP-binding protein [Polyangiaceae bacterium]|jgi:signal transduction histidine kinase|nr:ATP-binding protein [Polyangiaceae bacterium]
MWVTGARLLVTTLLLGSTAFFYLRGGLQRYPESMSEVFTTIAVAYALSAVEAMVLRTGKRLRELAYVHIILDQLLWTAIVYVSGGASSGATSFYGLTVLVGAVLIGLRGAAFAGVFGFSLYGLLCVGFLSHVVLPPGDQPGYAVTRDAIGYPLLLNALAITVVAMLAGYLSERLQQAGGALEVARRRYTEAERLAELGRISAWLAHEIRNPLGSISGSIEMLREGEALTPEEKKLCDIVSREVIRLNDLVSDMVDLSKTREPAVENVDVGQLTREVVELATRSRGAEDHHIEYVEEDVTSPLRAKCDPAQMRQVLWNLVRNALQASPSRGVVRVGVGAQGDKATVWVEDDGAGIDDDAKTRIFDAFYTTRAHGAGIGLAVVKRIIDDHQKHGVAIMVESAASGRKGARFKISLSRVL